MESTLDVFTTLILASSWTGSSILRVSVALIDFFDKATIAKQQLQYYEILIFMVC
jgi:hypothetical protein